MAGSFRRSNARVLPREHPAQGDAIVAPEVILIDEEPTTKRQRCDHHAILVDDDEDSPSTCSGNTGVIVIDSGDEGMAAAYQGASELKTGSLAQLQVEQEHASRLLAEHLQRQDKQEQEQAGWAAALKMQAEETAAGRSSRAVAEELQQMELLQAEAQRGAGILDFEALNKRLALGPAPRAVMRGDAPLMLNKLARVEAASQQGAVALPQEVTTEELNWHGPFLQNAFLTSFGVDYNLVRQLAHRSPAGQKNGGVIICDNFDHDSEADGYDANTYAPWVVVLPPFFSSDATTKQRARLEKGTMHPKLQLLEFDGGTAETRFLRVIVGSANIGAYSQGINQQYWCHDFPLCQDGGTCPDTEFKNDLLHFIHALLRPLSRDHAPDLARGNGWVGELPARWGDILSKYDLTPPPGTHLIMSVPGRHGPDSCSMYGYKALKRHLDRWRPNPLDPDHLTPRPSPSSLRPTLNPQP